MDPVSPTPAQSVETQPQVAPMQPQAPVPQPIASTPTNLPPQEKTSLYLLGMLGIVLILVLGAFFLYSSVKPKTSETSTTTTTFENPFNDTSNTNPFASTATASSTYSNPFGQTANAEETTYQNPFEQLK